MFSPNEKILTAPTAVRSAAATSYAPDYSQDHASCGDRDSRQATHVERRRRGSYYIFREGMLQMQSFDRQTIGW
jgi:hypothetical protein